ncbi:ABC transporter ATP-binding protein [Arcobacter sp. FWKO B]|uniref:ABC transporter ATP-binding protein n=1 Tax=Arcobacter sp. FWKO B TaxID=2593672 RepID=UPI0018A680E1|nr:ABC transporter ATP-binding protein [Arcobacter sp. FWKO B]QOG13198.1 ABC transporter ATP-binding protein [Arcobacter sp. FWKO B]
MKQLFKQYIPYYKNYIKQFIFAFIGIVLVAIGTSGTAYIIKPVLDEIFINKDQTMLYILPYFVIALYFAKGFGKYIQVYYISYIGQDIIRILRDKLLKHILSLDISFFHSRHGGVLISRLTNDINRIQVAVSTHIAELIRETLTIVALIGVVIYQSPKLAFFGLIILPLAIYPLSLLARKMKKLSFRSQEKIADITTHLSEIFNNIEIIKANSTQNVETKKFAEHNKNFFSINMKGVKTNELTSPLMETLGAIAVAVVIIVGGNEVIEGKLSVGAFFSFMTALFMLYTPIKKIASVYNAMQDAIAANERINEIFYQTHTIKNGTLQLNSTINRIKFENASLNYGEKEALKNINLEVHKGEKIALIGDSGGGKSSLVNLIIRFYDTSNGQIFINDTDIKEFDIESLRSNISIVTQRIYIFNDTVANNVAYGMPYDEEKVLQALKLAHADSFVTKLENGIHTILDEFGTNLSGGQRQRIAIARALYKNPQIIIFDEATSALDNESESIITDVLDEISKDKIVFVIAHRLSTIKTADCIAVFKNGEIVGYGTDQELKSNSGEYNKLLNYN